jgi:hypothetical protein
MERQAAKQWTEEAFDTAEMWPYRFCLKTSWEREQEPGLEIKR